MQGVASLKASLRGARRRIAVVSGVLGLLAGAACGAPPERTLAFDVIELVQGRETPGKPELLVSHEGFDYCFSTPENKARFEREPGRFEIADGGACGRMGPLAGLGDARRWSVHEGRVFVFASDGCRTRFTQDPVRFIERDDPRPEGDAASLAAGAALMDQLVSWAGGAERLRNVRTYRDRAARVQAAKDKNWTVTNSTMLSFPDHAATRETWDALWYSTVRTPAGGAMGSEKGLENIAAARTRAFDRALSRSLIVILRAFVDRGISDGAEFVAVADGEGRVGDVEVAFVKVWQRGGLSRLAIEKGTGRPVQLSFRARDGSSSVAVSERTYTAYATVEGVQLPTAYTVVFDGKAMAEAGMTLEGFEINPQLPPDTFALGK